MKVWIEVLTPKQALFFEPLYRELRWPQLPCCEPQPESHMINRLELLGITVGTGASLALTLSLLDAPQKSSDAP